MGNVLLHNAHKAREKNSPEQQLQSYFSLPKRETFKLTNQKMITPPPYLGCEN